MTRPHSVTSLAPLELDGIEDRHGLCEVQVGAVEAIAAGRHVWLAAGGDGLTAPGAKGGVRR